MRALIRVGDQVVRPMILTNEFNETKIDEEFYYKIHFMTENMKLYEIRVSSFSLKAKYCLKVGEIATL